MSLKAFHLVFITLSSLLAFGFGAWALASRRVSAGLGVVSLVLGTLLVVYGIWFQRKIRTRDEEDERRRRMFRGLPAALVVVLLAPRAAAACSACYGAAGGPMIDAARLGVYLLFGIVFAVQIGFVAFFLALRRRARAHRQKHPEWVPQ